MLSNLSMRQHVSVLKDVNHRDDTDVLAVLHKDEHNTTGIRYVLAAPVTISLDRRSFVKKIDIYFTDTNGTRLEGDYAPTPVVGTEYSDIEAEHNAGRIGFFADSEALSYYTQDSDDTSPADAVDQTIYQWKARLPDDNSVVFTRSSEDGIVIKQFTKPADTTQVYGVTTNGAGGSYEYMVDSNLGYDLGDAGPLYMLWETRCLTSRSFSSALRCSTLCSSGGTFACMR